MSLTAESFDVATLPEPNGVASQVPQAPLVDSSDAQPSEALKLNRCLSVARIGAGTQAQALEVRAPLAGEGLRVTRYDWAAAPELCRFLETLPSASAGRALQIPPDWLDALRTAGVLVKASQWPRQVRFACPLPTASEIPAQLAGITQPLPDWIVHPRLRLLDSQSAFNAPWRYSPLAPCAAAAWLDDPITGLSWGFTLDQDQAASVARLAAGRLRPQDLSIEPWRCYAAAGLLVSRSQLVAQRRIGRWRLNYWREHLAREGYVRMNRLLPRPLLRALQTYFASLVAQGHLPFNDRQSMRYYGHSEPMAVWLHWQLSALIESVIDTPSKPSYAFLGSYVPGADLPRHTDREQCEHTLSLTLDAAPDARRRAAWPLCLEDRNGRALALRLAPGDALLFKGRELPHWRDPLVSGTRSTSAFLHFVPAGFDRPVN